MYFRVSSPNNSHYGVSNLPGSAVMESQDSQVLELASWQHCRSLQVQVEVEGELAGKYLEAEEVWRGQGTAQRG